MFYRLFLLLSIFLLGSELNAQLKEIPVTIKISNTKKEMIPLATVNVSSAFDSTIHISRAADTSGMVKVILKENTNYTVTVTAVGYALFEKSILVTEKNHVFSFSLEHSGKTLEAAVVVSKKPLMRQEDDKLIVEPENLVASSTNGYEVIEKTPGLFVDQDGNIYISSLTPATVQINGRDMKMSASDVATLLKNLPPNSIQRIEIVKTPSAKYDASGNGGIVNVVLKKGVKIGMTGSVTTGWQQGKYGNEFVGISLNNNTGKQTTYLNLNYGKRNSFEQIKTDRRFAPDSMLSQDAYTQYPANSFYTALGSTWQLDKKWELTFDANMNYNTFNNHTDNKNTIRKISSSQLISDNLNTVNNKGHSLLLGTGIETKYKIDTLGSEWSNDTYYSHAVNKSDQVFQTNYITPLVPVFGGDGKANNTRDYFTGRSDLKLKMKSRFTFETGVQSTIHVFKNIADYFREYNGNRVKDGSRTNTFRYSENINSFYLQGSKTLGKNFVAKFGTRLENTNMKGHQFIPADTSFAIHRTDLFPYVYLSKKLMAIAGFELRAYLVYRRSIRRPFYDQLNPFPRYIDQYLTEVGNTSLRPQFTQNYEANVSVDERPILAVGINETKDIFTQVVYQSDTSQSQAYRTFDNLGKNKEWYLRGLGAIPPGGRFFFVLGAQYNHNYYDGIYENKPLSFKRGTWTFFTYQTFKIDKRSVISINGFFRLKGQQGFYELGSFGALNANINRKFLKDKLVVTLSMNDIFETNKNNFTINQGSIHASGLRRADTRRVGINIRYNFGMKKKEDNGSMFNAEPPVN
jgi:hypothetical protein